jgi:hypothetical protein
MATGIKILEPAFPETARESAGAFIDMLAEHRMGQSSVDRIVENLPGEEQCHGRSASSFGAATRSPEHRGGDTLHCGREVGGGEGAEISM